VLSSPAVKGLLFSLRAPAPILLLLAAIGCGRREEAPAAREAPSARPAAVENDDAASRNRRPGGGRHPVIWLGFDGLDWEFLDRLAAQGRMPNWKRLTSEGFSAKLTSVVPLISPILWTTAATGVGPEIHRVLDFQEVDSKTGQKVPISGLSRAVPAVWNMASAAGRKVGVVGWWATHPAEEVNGFFLSDHASPILVDRLPLEGAAFPTTLQVGLAQVIARDGKISDADLAPFLDVPVSEINAARSNGAGLESPIVALSRILSATRISQRAARDLYDKNLPDAMLLYFEGTDEIGHIFAPFTPPRLACISDADAARYGSVAETYFRIVDRILGQWMRRAQEDGATLLVHSDHGFKWGEDRPCQFASGNVATAAFWHRLDGVLAAWGARVKPSVERGRASLFDVAPTVLALLDLSADKSMPGHAIPAFADLKPPPPAVHPASIVIRRVPAEKMSAEQSSEFAKKLLALGYLSPSETQPLAPTGGDRPGLTEGAWNNLGVYERETRKNFAAAKQDFEKSLALRPDYYAAMFNLAVLYRSQGDTKKAEEWLLRSLAALKADPAPAVAAWAREYEKQGTIAAARSILEQAIARYPDNEALAREAASLLYRGKDCRGAIGKLARFEETTKDPKTLNALALFHTCLADREAVIRLLERSLVLAPNQPEIARLLATVKSSGASR